MSDCNYFYFIGLTCKVSTCVCYNAGQYRPIRAVRFIAENTVEERILQLQEKKRLVFDGTVGRDAGSLAALTVNDMKSLFS
mmetsp:Transcript_21214/g.61746  ORF Transcript_21214/g.61746 Transcript_21214/m.61746 type:complete len:81 (-) Transcript_21214:83-325(-)